MTDDERTIEPVCIECGAELDELERREPFVCFACATAQCAYCQHRHQRGQECPERAAREQD